MEAEAPAQLQAASEAQARAFCESLVTCVTKILDPHCPQVERAVCEQVAVFPIAAHHSFSDFHCTTELYDSMLPDL